MPLSPTFKLANTTQAIPAVGFGCWKVSKELAPSIVENAIEKGYRHIDSAADYGKNCLRPLTDLSNKVLDFLSSTLQILTVIIKLNTL